MKNRFIILFCFIFAFYNASASQTDLKINLNISQSAIDDWRLGKKVTLEVLTGFELKSNFKIDTMQVIVWGKVNLGALYEKNEQRTDPILLPTANEIFAETTLRYPFGWTVDPFFTSTNSTQLVRAYRMVGQNRVRTADYRDPAITMQTFGMAYTYKINNTDYLNNKIGVSLKQTRANEFTVQTDDLKTKDVIENYKAESGISFSNDSYFKIDSSLTYKSRLDLFGTFKHPDKWTVKWQNELQISIISVLAIILKLDVNYDEIQSKRIQYIQSSRFGITANLRLEDIL